MPPLRERERTVVGILLVVFLVCSFSNNYSRINHNNCSSTCDLSSPVNLAKYSDIEESYILPNWTHKTTNPEYIRPIEISDDGSTIVEAAGNWLRIFNKTSNQTIWSYDTQSVILDGAVSKNGSYITIATFSGFLILFHRSSSTPLWISNCSGYVYKTDISDNGSYIVAGDSTGCIYAFTVQSNESIWRYNTSQPIVSLSLSSDGSTIIGASVHDWVYVFDNSANETIWKREFSENVGAVSVCRNGSILVVGAQEGTFLFSKVSNASIWSYDEEFEYVQISEDGTTIAATNSENNTNTLYLWDSSSNRTLWKYNGTERFTKVSMSESGSKLVAGGYGNVSVVFTRTSNISILRHPCESYIIDVAMSANGTQFVTSCGDGHTYYFSLNGPHLVEVTMDKEYYNQSEIANISVMLERGSSRLNECSVNYSMDGISWSSKLMKNETPLTDDLVIFNTSLEPLASNISFYIIVGDLLQYEIESMEYNIFVDGIAPCIHTINHSPITPSSNDNVLVTANVTDSFSGIEEVVVNYKDTRNTEWIQTDMHISGNSLYEATIPMMANGTTVQYYIVVTDAVGNTNVDDNAGDYYEYIVSDEDALTITNTSSITETNQTPDNSMLILTIILLASLASIATIVIVYELHRRTTTNEEKDSIVENQSEVSNEETLNKTPEREPNET